MSNEQSAIDTESSFSGLLKFLRLRRSFGVTEMAERLGISRSHLANIENGLRSPGRKLIYRFADEYDFLPEELLEIREYLAQPSGEDGLFALPHAQQAASQVGQHTGLANMFNTYFREEMSDMQQNRVVALLSMYLSVSPRTASQFLFWCFYVLTRTISGTESFRSFVESLFSSGSGRGDFDTAIQALEDACQENQLTPLRGHRSKKIEKLSFIAERLTATDLDYLLHFADSLSRKILDADEK